jgi:transcriptional regulator with XRE-family HTH domain
MTIGERLLIARKNEGLSQEQVAKLCGLDPSTISFFECNKRTPVVRNILKLAEALNVSTDQILGRHEMILRVVPCPMCDGSGRILNEPKQPGPVDVAEMKRTAAP